MSTGSELPARASREGADRPEGGRHAAVCHAQRAAGQAGSLASMIASERPFEEVALQVLAARGSLDSLLIRLLELELDSCLPSAHQRDEVGALASVALGRRRAARSPDSDPPLPQGPTRPVHRQSDCSRGAVGSDVT